MTLNWATARMRNFWPFSFRLRASSKITIELPSMYARCAIVLGTPTHDFRSLREDRRLERDIPRWLQGTQAHPCHNVLPTIALKYLSARVRRANWSSTMTFIYRNLIDASAMTLNHFTIGQYAKTLKYSNARLRQVTSPIVRDDLTPIRYTRASYHIRMS